MSSEATPDTPQKDSLVAQFKSLTGVFWIAGWMEIIERFSYYGARVVLPVFMVAAIGNGGPELTQIEKGQIFAFWAVVQSFVPILSGGFADRYGYKVNIAISSALKLMGYLVMAFCIPLAELLAGMPLAEARAAGTDHVYGILFVGSILVAFGTAIFKPGIGGLITSQLTPRNSALGWSVFYQLVNIGGFVGPLVAGYLRVIEWHWVFIICGGAIALNFIPLFFFAEPAQPESTEKKPGPIKMFYQSICGLLEPRLFFYTLSFCGFWLMTFQIFDILPNFIDDWVDSRHLAAILMSIFGENAVPTINGGNLTQEWMLNFNPLLISLGTFIMGYYTRKVPPLITIIIGIIVAIFATYGLGMSMNGWWVLACILTFSLGEMLSGPANSYYIVSIAPEGKKGLYIGFSGFTVGIGWSIGSIIASHLYQDGGDKVVLAKRYLVDKMGVDAATLADMPKEKIMPYFEKVTGTDPFAARDLLWNAYDPASMWTIFAIIGLGSLLILHVYNKVMTASKDNPDHYFNRHGHRLVQCLLIPIALVFIYCTWVAILTDLGLWSGSTLGFPSASTFNELKHTFDSLKEVLALPFKSVLTAIMHSAALLLNTVFFVMMMVISLLPKHMRSLG